MSITYTHAERTVKKYTVADAIDAAKARCTGSICTDAIQGRALTEPITLVELNHIADSICDDTALWN